MFENVTPSSLHSLMYQCAFPPFKFKVFFKDTKTNIYNSLDTN